MVLSNILLRTFFIKAEQYGTAFTLDVDGVEYLVTARHLLDTSLKEFVLKLFHTEQWHDIPAVVVGHGRGEVDISVLRLQQSRLTQPGLEVTPTIAGMGLGQDVYFLGFPYKMWGNVGNLFGGMPCAFAKKGTLSSFSVAPPQILYVDAINNEGFSGGPVVFYPANNPTQICVAGVVSKFKIEYETVLDAMGEETTMSVPYNTGFMVAYGAKHIIDIIEASRRR